MSRGFKFRYYDNFKKRMESFEGMPMMVEELESVNEPETMIVNQYTGVKDKNDAEIYEGDILRQNKYPTPDMKIKFIDGCFVGVSTDIIQEINWQPSKLSKLNELEYVVIGNIYEHPHLLEGKK